MIWGRDPRNSRSGIRPKTLAFVVGLPGLQRDLVDPELEHPNP